MSELLFIEDFRDAAAAQVLTASQPAIEIVSLTAEAAQAAEEIGLTCHLTAEYANTFALAAADDSLNAVALSLAQCIDEYIRTRDSSWGTPPGPLAGQAYYLQYSISAIAKRAYLMREVVRALRPDRVTTFEQDIDPWFSGDGYRENPWMIAIAGSIDSWDRLSRVVARPAASVPRPSSRQSLLGHAGRSLDKAARSLMRWRAAWAGGPSTPDLGPSQARFGRMRMLMVGRFVYDWDLVGDSATRAGASCYRIEGAYLNARQPWTLHYRNTLKSWDGRHVGALDTPAPQASPEETARIASLVGEWAASQSPPPRFDVLGIDVWPALQTHITAVAGLSAALARHADAIAAGALEQVRPDIVCFPSMANLADVRLAHAARARCIPVATYQHGFGYGVQIQAKDEQIETMHSDYFLTYGSGIQPRQDGPFRARAQYVPVGSSRVASMMLRSRLRGVDPKRRPTILWVAESSTRNTHVSSLPEDTLRYTVERRCLAMLDARATTRIVYRPYPHCMDFDGLTRWAREAHLPSVDIDVIRPFAELIERSDLVVVNTSSPTTWAEVLALGRPMILHCDPRQTRLVESFQVELEKVCRWCRDADAVVAAVNELAENPWSLIEQETGRDRRQFLADYVLGPPDAQPLQHVATFLGTVLQPEN